MNNYQIKIFFLLLTIPVGSFAESIRVEPGASPMKISAQTVVDLGNYVSLGPYQGSGTTFANIAGFVYGSHPRGSGIQCTKMSSWKCIDGYCGIPVDASNTDIIYIPSGTVYAQFKTSYTGSVVDGTVQFNTKTPTFNKAQIYSPYACFPQSPNSQSYYVNGGANERTTINANLDWYIYAPASAKARSISVDQISIVGVFSETGSSRVAIPQNDITVRNVLTCAISPPSVVDFGTVNITGANNDDILANVSGELNISCTGNQGVSFPSRVKVTGDVGRYSNTLKMTLDNSNTAPAEIRGFIGAGIQQIAVCDGNTAYPGWIRFLSGGGYNDGGVLSNGVNKIPYSFTLCATGKSDTGNATAQATIDIDWDY